MIVHGVPEFLILEAFGVGTAVRINHTNLSKVLL